MRRWNASWMSPTPVPQDVSKPDQHRQADAAQHQVIGELLEIDGAGRILRRMHQHVAVGGDREVAFAPAIDFVQLGGVVDGEELACLPGSVPSRRGSAHAFIMHTFFYDGRAIGQKRGGERARHRSRASPIDPDGRSSRTCARDPEVETVMPEAISSSPDARPSEPASTETTS